VKSNVAIRGSDRRKLKDHVSKSFPLLPSDELLLLVPNKDPMTVMTVLTYNETNVTCYCLHKTPILFDVDGTLLPTVYTLWKFPRMLITFKTSQNVFPILSGGADLMFPGVLEPRSGFPEFQNKTPSCVSLLGNGAAVAVGTTSCSRDELVREGCAGKRVVIYHCFKDYLWAHGEKENPPLIPDFVSVPDDEEEDALDGGGGAGDASNVDQAETGMTSLAITGTNNGMDTRLEDVGNGGTQNGQLSEEMVEVGGEETLNEQPAGDSTCDVDDVAVAKEELPEEPQLTPQEEMGLLLENCFCQALLDAKKIELPILVSKFSSQYLHPACPDGRRIDVKKSPYKKMSLFLSEMQKEGLVTVKELSKGVESITEMNIQNERMQEYSKSEFAQQRKVYKLERLEEEKEKKKADSKTIEVRELFAVSAKVAPFFKLYGKNKGAVMCSSDIRQLVTSYVKDHELVNPSNKKLINLDPLLTDVLFNKGQHQDSANWDGIMTRILQNMNPCHEVTCPGEESVIRKGKMDSIEVSIENRMGNKKVTVIKNLESFGIETKSFAQSLQQAAASSTAVNPVPGKTSTATMVIVQGMQLKHVKNILESYKVPLKYVKGLQGTKK